MSRNEKNDIKYEQTPKNKKNIVKSVIIKENHNLTRKSAIKIEFLFNRNQMNHSFFANYKLRDAQEREN